MTGLLTILIIWFLSLNEAVFRRNGQGAEQGDVVPMPSSDEDSADLIEAA